MSDAGDLMFLVHPEEEEVRVGPGAVWLCEEVKEGFYERIALIPKAKIKRIVAVLRIEDRP